jgi:hypothetical protein
MLWLLGHLNSSDAVTFGDRRPEVPMIEMLRFMLDELANPQQIDAVRVAALNGILRHVKIDRDLPEGSRRLVGNAAETMIVNAMTSLLEAKQPPEGRAAERMFGCSGELPMCWECWAAWAGQPGGHGPGADRRRR